ncbi:MAG: phospholipase/Carboxylesterase [Actinobacteria bacterium]|jgi:phospholipase/carboxylesterase|nr:phospholipase/Carboxylesterase [Actinomycetota bacterium]
MTRLDELTHLVRHSAGAPEGALVLFHGRGSDEYDLYRLLDDLDPDQRLLGVTPRGPLSLPPGGAHWYITRQVGYPDPGTFHATYRLVSGWLDELARSTGIPTERTILGGFSQGAVMTHAMGLGAGRPRPAAMLAFSGFIPTVEGFDIDLSAPLPPVAIGHGTYDNIIAVEFGREARDRLTAAGADVTYRESPIRHGIDPGFLDELVPWVASAIDRAAVARG